MQAKQSFTGKQSLGNDKLHAEAIESQQVSYQPGSTYALDEVSLTGAQQDVVPHACNRVHQKRVVCRDTFHRDLRRVILLASAERAVVAVKAPNVGKGADAATANARRALSR